MMLNRSRTYVFGQLAVFAAFFLFAANTAKANVILNKTLTNRLNQGLIGYWTFDPANMTNGRILDLSGRGNTVYPIFISTTSFYAAGILGQGVRFDGIQNYVTIASSSTNIDVQNRSFSISLWVKRLDSNSGGLISRRNGGSAAGWNFYINSPGTFLLQVDDGVNSATETHVLSTINVWTHAVAVVNRTTNLSTIYINGSSNGPIDISSVTGYADSGPLCIGNVQPCGGSVRRLNGYMDDVRVYNRALSDTEIKALYGMGKSRLGTIAAPRYNKGLIGYWNFDGSNITNGRINDLSGNGKSGYPLNISTSTFYRVGKIGQAVRFDGKTSRIDTGVTSIGVSNASICTWLYLYSYITNNRIFYNANTILSINSAFKRLNFYSDGSTAVSSANNSLPLNSWTHVCVTRDAAGLANFFINGTLSGTANQSSGTPSQGAIHDYIGGENTTSNVLDGALDDVRVYNRVLSDAEIKALYNMGQSKINTSLSNRLTSGLVQYWTFDGSKITNRVLDSTSNNNSGFLRNMATTSVVVPGKIGQALRFNTLNQCVTNDSISMTSFPLTLSHWINLAETPNDFDDSIGIARFGVDSPRIEWTAGVPDFSPSFGKTTNNAMSSSSFKDRKWHHIVGVSYSASDHRIFVDGVQRGVSTGTVSSQSINRSSVGCRWWQGVIESVWPGQIDDARIYNRALSPDEIKQLYTMGR